MKVVLAGSTGAIGGSILAQCLSHPSITEVLILTRRPLPVSSSSAQHPKAKVLIHKDFSCYNDPKTLAALASADAAIWCVGTYAGDRAVDVEFPLAFLSAVSEARTTKASAERDGAFRYIHLGGAFTEPPPSEGQEPRALWYFTNGRRLRGEGEAKVLAAATDEVEVYVAKPAAVVPRRWSLLGRVIGDGLSIGIEDLGVAMIGLALGRDEGDQRIFLNRDLSKRAKERK